MKALLLIFLSHDLIAQNWCPAGAEWYFRYDHRGSLFYTVGTNTVRLEDTVTENGILFKYCHASFYGKKRVGMDIVTTSQDLGTYKTYEAGNVLYVENSSGGFDTVLHFKAKPGDTWLVPLFPENCPSVRQHVTVIDTGRITLQGEYMQAFDFGFGLFPLKMYFAFPEFCGIDEMGYGAFDCYRDDNFPVYSFYSKTVGCNLVSLEEERPEGRQVLVYPNPNKGSFVISLQEASTARIFNHLGSLVYETVLQNRGEHAITIPQLPAGIYHLKTESRSGGFNHKLVLQ